MMLACLVILALATPVGSLSAPTPVTARSAGSIIVEGESFATKTFLHSVPFGTSFATLCSLGVTDDPDADDCFSVAHPDHPRERALRACDDPHGILGPWPSSIVAVAELAHWKAKLDDAAAAAPKKRVLEIGCGAGLPSLYAALVLGCDVVATDCEPLAIALVAEAYRSTAGFERRGRLETRALDVNFDETGGRSFRGGAAVDAIVACDMLYDEPTARALGAFVGRRAREDGAVAFVVDPGRRARAAFLEAFLEAAQVDWATFEDRPIPDWGQANARDLFDGAQQQSVGVLAHAKLPPPQPR